MSTRTEFVELVDEETGAQCARVPVQITEIKPGGEHPAGFYFFFMPQLGFERTGSKLEVVLQGPFDTDEECVLEAENFILKGAERMASETLGAVA